MGEIWLHSDYQSAVIKNVYLCIHVKFRFSTSMSVMTVYLDCRCLSSFT